MTEAKRKAEAMTTELNREALLPCPFCESSHITDRHVRDGRQMFCVNCGASVAPTYHGPTDTLERARAAWNRRAIPTPDAGDVGELVERLREISTNITSHVEAGDAWDAADALTAQASRIKELEGERDRARSGNRYAQLEALALTRAIRAEALLEQAKAALEPFAKESDLWVGYADEETLVEGWANSPESDINVADLRRARSTLAAMKGDDNAS